MMQVAHEQLKAIVGKQQQFPGVPAFSQLRHVAESLVTDTTLPLTDKDEVSSIIAGGAMATSAC